MHQCVTSCYNHVESTKCTAKVLLKKFSKHLKMTSGYQNQCCSEDCQNVWKREHNFLILWSKLAFNHIPFSYLVIYLAVFYKVLFGKKNKTKQN